MNPNYSPSQSFRELAIKCRQMASRSRRPASLLLRAESYDAQAAELDQHERIKRVAVDA